MPLQAGFCAKERTMHEWNTQSLQLHRESITLQAGDSVHLSGARGLRLQVMASPFPAEPLPLLWLTEEGEWDDVFLRPGDCHVLHGQGRMVATAWGSIGLRVVAKARMLTPATPSAAAPCSPMSEPPVQRSRAATDTHRSAAGQLPPARCGA